MAHKDQVDLQAALRGSVVPLSVKTLKKKGIRRVKVIEREKLLKALVQAVEQKLQDRPSTPTEGSPTEKKRVELLLIEIERVSRAKTQLEHEKGLLEAERSRLSAELERIAHAVSQGTGQKVKPEEVKNLLDELERIREDRDKTRKALDRALLEGERRIEAEIARARNAEAELADTGSSFEKTRAERDVLRAERDTLARKAARLDEVEAENARLVAERDRVSEKNLHLQRDLQRFRADYESALSELEAAAPLLAAHREAEAAKAAAAAPTPAPSTEPAPHPEAAPRNAVPSPRAAAAAKPRIPGFGFGGEAPAASAPPAAGRKTPPRTWS